MLRRRYVILALLILSVLAGTLLHHFITQAQWQPEYNPVADVTRDGVVNILDILKVAVHFGSSYTPITQPNRTTVTVLSYENGSLTFVENALIAVFPATGLQGGYWGTMNIIEVQITNSSGTVSFELDPNTNYIAIAWNERARYYANTAYNYADFTTNAKGEASVTIWLKPHPTSSPIRSSPLGWVIMTFYDNATGELLVYSEPNEGLMIIFREFEASHTSFEWLDDFQPFTWDVNEGILALAPDFRLDHPEWSAHRPRTSYAITFGPNLGSTGNFTYCTDDSGGAYAVGFYYH